MAVKETHGQCLLLQPPLEGAWSVVADGTLTVGGAVSEERHQERHVIDVLQVRTDLVDTTR